VKPEEERVVDCLVACSLENHEELKLKSLDLLLSLFSKNKHLEEFLGRLNLIYGEEDSMMFMDILKIVN
jgi:hypothetical protein